MRGGGESPIQGLELGKVEDRMGPRSIAAPPGKISGPKMESKGSPDMQAIYVELASSPEAVADEPAVSDLVVGEMVLLMRR